MVYIGVFVPRCEDEQEEIKSILSRPYSSERKQATASGRQSGDLIPTEIRRASRAEKQEEYQKQVAKICLCCRKCSCSGKCAEYKRRANGIYRQIYGHKARKIY